MDVSVIIATYNRGKKIAATLDSVLQQTYRAREIIVVDDGSTDDTGEWIRAAYPDVHLRRCRNGGSSFARNVGAAEAQGDVLVFLDHDDQMLPHCISTLVGGMSAFPDAIASFGDHELRNLVDGKRFANHHSEIEDFERLRFVPSLACRGAARLYGEGLFHALLWGNLLQQPWAIRRDSFNAIGGFDQAIRYCEDWDLYLRVVKRGPITLTDEVIAIHFIEGQNLHRAPGQQEQHMKVIHKHIRSTALRDWRCWSVLRARLANYYKGIGDGMRDSEIAEAWKNYLRSFLMWPMDHVVAARCLILAPSALAHRMRRRVQ